MGKAFAETETVEKGFRDMNITAATVAAAVKVPAVITAVEAVTDVVTMTPVTPTKNNSLPPLRLTLRKKLSPVLDEVLASVNHLTAVSPNSCAAPADSAEGSLQARRR